MAATSWASKVGSSSTTKMRMGMQALVLIALFDRNDGAIDGVHFDFQQRAIGLQQADLIDKLAVLGFKLQLNHLARILFFHLVQYGAQGQPLALLQSLAGQLMVAAVGVTDGQGTGPQGQAQAGAAQGPSQGAGVHSGFLSSGCIYQQPPGCTLGQLNTA